VVPGGVRDAEELRGAVAADPVVAEHYSGFRLAQARTVRLDRPTAMFVSYRVRNRVYWTKTKMVIPAGETLISDGEHLTRVRCGNRLSDFAAGPVSLYEPPREKLETPEWVPPLLAQILPGDGGDPFPPPASALADLPVPPGETGPGPKGTLPPPSFPPILPPGVPPPGYNNGPTPPTPVATPEPGSLILLLGGAVLSATLAALVRK